MVSNSKVLLCMKQKKHLWRLDHFLMYAANNFKLQMLKFRIGEINWATVVTLTSGGIENNT